MSKVNRFCQVISILTIASFAAVLLAAQLAVAQNQPAAAEPAASSPEIHATLEKIVHPKKVKVGDEVVARMTEPTKLKDGTELPKGTHIIGKVTDIKMKADKEGPSKLGLLFDKAQLKDGKEVPLSIALVSVAPHWSKARWIPSRRRMARRQPVASVRCHRRKAERQAVPEATRSIKAWEFVAQHR